MDPPTVAQHAFLFNPSSPNATSGTVIDLGDLPGGIDQSVASGINVFGQVVGHSSATSPTVSSHGFLWTPTLPNGAAGSMTDIGGLPGGTDGTLPTAINNAGKIVGRSNVINDSGGRGYRAFLWTPSTPNGTSGSMQDLGLLNPLGNDSIANAINNHDQVVGWSLVNPGTALTHAFIWTSGEGMIDLNTQVDASGAGWVLKDAVGINDFGQIVGNGTNPAGDAHAFLLTPTPEPAALALLPFIVVQAMSRQRRR
jgi:probable HAF family extracellular repeat protein